MLTPALPTATLPPTHRKSFKRRKTSVTNRPHKRSFSSDKCSAEYRHLLEEIQKEREGGQLEAEERGSDS